MVKKFEHPVVGKPASKFKLLRLSLEYALKNKNWLKANKLKSQISELLTRANIEIGKMNYSNEEYVQRVSEYNQAVIEAEKAKYYWEQAMDTGDKAYWKKSFCNFHNAVSIGSQLLNALREKSHKAISNNEPVFSCNDTEIVFADEVPLVPEILPLVILQGSDFDMGYQYAQQIILIYGPWILQRKAGKHFTKEELDCMGKWEEQIRQYAPEILEMCRGWAAGATDSGVAMSYEDVLDFWTGHTPPAKLPYNLSGIGLPAELAHPFCSGVAAWGRATVDGKLVTASTGDHNPAHAAVIVAFPETGNNFIATPFHVTGDIRSAPRMFMMGHPGMNSKGLAYVEHGGEPRIAEPMEHWGYGIRKGAAIFHLLRFANSAREAQQMELEFPVGDVGTVMGSAGGIWADSSYGYVSECRKEPVAIREAGMLGETDFLYACNGILHPGLKDVWWMQLDSGNWSWDKHGGWYPLKYKNFERGMMGNPWEILQISASMIQTGNKDRCLYYYEMMDRALGSIDLEYMKMVLRNGGTPPSGDWEEITAEFAKTGRWGKVSAAHSTNAVTTVMKPDNGNEGIYTLCHGEARRGLEPFSPKQVIYMYNETNAFWEIKLGAAPEDVVSHTRNKAKEHIEKAQKLLLDVTFPSSMSIPLKGFLEESQKEFEDGLNAENEAKAINGNKAVYSWSKAARKFTRAQVRALQVIQAIEPPPSTPEDFLS